MSKEVFVELANYLAQAYKVDFPAGSDGVSTTLLSQIKTEGWRLWESKPRPSMASKLLSDLIAQLETVLGSRDIVERTAFAGRGLAATHYAILTGAPYILDKAFADLWGSSLERIQRSWLRSSEAANNIVARYCAWLIQKLQFQRKYRQLHGSLTPRSFSQFGGSGFQELADVLTDLLVLQNDVNALLQPLGQRQETLICLHPVLLESASLFLLLCRLLSRLNAVLVSTGARPRDRERMDTICRNFNTAFEAFRAFVARAAATLPQARDVAATTFFAPSFKLDLVAVRSLQDTDIPFPPSSDSTSPRPLTTSASSSLSSSLLTSSSSSSGFGAPPPSSSSAFSLLATSSPSTPTGDLLFSTEKSFNEDAFLSIPTPAAPAPAYPAAAPQFAAAPGYYPQYQQQVQVPMIAHPAAQPYPATAFAPFPGSAQPFPQTASFSSPQTQPSSPFDFKF